MAEPHSVCAAVRDAITLFHKWLDRQRLCSCPPGLRCSILPSRQAFCTSLNENDWAIINSTALSIYNMPTKISYWGWLFFMNVMWNCINVDSSQELYLMLVWFVAIVLSLKWKAILYCTSTNVTVNNNLLSNVCIMDHKIHKKTERFFKCYGIGDFEALYFLRVYQCSMNKSICSVLLQQEYRTVKVSHVLKMSHLSRTMDFISPLNSHFNVRHLLWFVWRCLVK